MPVVDRPVRTDQPRRSALILGNLRLWANAERISAIVALCLSVGLLVASLSYGLEDGNQVAPGFFPSLVSGALVLLSSNWLFIAARTDATASEDVDPIQGLVGHLVHDLDSPGRGRVEETEPPLERRRLLLVVLWTAVTVPFVDFAGMVPVLFVYVSGLLVSVAGVRLWKAVLTTFIAVLLVAYGAYEAGIYLPDPLGIGEFLARVSF